MNKGLNLFGYEGVEPERSEMEQLHRMGSLQPKTLTRAQRKRTLSYLMYLKWKSTGRIKGRGCADSRKQREYITRQEATSSTVSTEAVLMTAIFDASEGREVAIIDIPGAYLHADMDDIVFVRFEGTMVEFLEKIDPKMYRPYVEIAGTRKMFYTRSYVRGYMDA